MSSKYFRLRIESKKWVGVTGSREQPQLQLSPISTVVRDFELPRASRKLAISRTVDEAGEPVPGVPGVCQGTRLAMGSAILTALQRRDNGQ